MRSVSAAIAFVTLLVACSGKTASTPGADAPTDAATPASPEPPCDTGPGVTTLVPPSGQFAYDIVVDDQWVWYAASDGVHRVSHAGTGDELVGAGQDAVALAIVGSQAWFFGNYSVGSGPKPMSSAALFSVSSDGGTPGIVADGAWSPVLATDGSSLFWPSGASGVSRLDPPSTIPVVLFSGAASLVQGLAIDDSYVYVPSAGLDGADGSIGRVAKSGGSLVTIVEGQAHPAAIAVDDTCIYWANQGSGQVFDGSFVPDAILSANKDGSNVTVLVSDPSTALVRGIVDVAVDTENVFWIETTSGRVMKMPKRGGAESVIASGLTSPNYLAVHGGNVYWENDTSGTLSEGEPNHAVQTACK